MRTFKVTLVTGMGLIPMIVTAINPEDAMIRAEAKFTANHGSSAVALEVEAA